jgi:hypothetical protein
MALGWIGSTTPLGNVRQEAVDQMRSRDRLRLGAAISLELGPDDGERQQRPVVAVRERDDVFLLVLNLDLP